MGCRIKTLEEIRRDVTAEQYRRLVARIGQQARDNLRAAIRYEPDDWDVLYLRDDLASEELRDALPLVFERLRGRSYINPEAEYDRLGEPLATAEVHAEAVLLHFQIGPERGIIVTLDRDATRRISTFVEACRNELP